MNIVATINNNSSDIKEKYSGLLGCAAEISVSYISCKTQQ